MAPYTWSYLGDTVSDATHHMYYRGQRIKEAYYRGEKIWGEPEVGSVRILDWNGDILAEYSANEFLSLRSMPELHRLWSANMLPFTSYSSTFYGSANLQDITTPITNGDEQILFPDEYNWSFEEAQDFVSKVGFCDIAAIYKADYTYLWITIPYSDRLTVSLFFTPLDSNPIIVEFGDGSTETFNVAVTETDIAENDSLVGFCYHTYPSVGHYLVKIRGKIALGEYIYNATADREVFFNPTVQRASFTSSYYNYYVNRFTGERFNSSDLSDYRGGYVYGAYLGNGCRLNPGCFHGCQMSGIGLANGTNIPCWGEFSYLSYVTFIAFPKSITYTYDVDENYQIPLVSKIGDPYYSTDIAPLPANSENVRNELSKYIYRSSFGNPVDTAKHSQQWGRGVEVGAWSSIRSLSLNPYFRRLYLPYAGGIQRLVIPERMSTLGLMAHIGGTQKNFALKTLVLGTWDMSYGAHVPLRDNYYGNDHRYCLARQMKLVENMDITGDEPFSFYVPKYIYGLYEKGAWKEGWRNGVEHITEMLSDEYYKPIAWLLPYLKEAPCFTDYRK